MKTENKSRFKRWNGLGFLLVGTIAFFYNLWIWRDIFVFFGSLCFIFSGTYIMTMEVKDVKNSRFKGSMLFGFILIALLIFLTQIVPLWNYYLTHSFDTYDWCSDEYWDNMKQTGNNVTHHCMEILGGYRW